MINWTSKIKFKSLLNEKQKNTIAKRIVCFDCEVEAISLSHARSKAYNIIKDFSTYLAALLNVGFSPYMGIFKHFITKEIQGKEICFTDNFQREGFLDKELNLIVSDNMNGLHHINDYLSVQPNTYFSYFINDKFETKGGYIQNNDEILNTNLKNTFKSIKITKVQGRAEYSDNIDYDGQYKLNLLVPKQIRKFFKEINNLDDTTGRYFRNSCRLYNISLIVD
ncbi:hypothetical protein [Inconstantimicrobium porci]|uniref:hypothetical protein n=1 Tax=Inconstantimicrobium porci TaxID=2652291 RepID=UPI0012B29391|nr:hypothetical protein [Inconstantimicrobium porci]